MLIMRINVPSHDAGWDKMIKKNQRFIQEYKNKGLPKWAAHVLKFWFVKSLPTDWFAPDPKFDETIRLNFMKLLMRFATKTPQSVYVDSHAALAFIVVCDQFPRNIFRGQANAFAFDALALYVAKNAVDKKLQHALSNIERAFLYMPFMHSESLEDQRKALELYRELGNKDELDYAIKHHDIVEKFGRFPHRNPILGRKSTDMEVEYLKTADRFGQ
ncbi:MAG: DUF924 family protein [Alphaproteobacteria bacterium]